jgi:hypothetical protein
VTAARRKAWLLAALGLAIAYWAWTLKGDAPDGKVSIGAGGGRKPQARPAAAAQVAELATGELERKPGVYQQGRDLFRYGQPPRPEPPQGQEVAPPPPPPDPVPVEPPKPQPPSVDVVYLGSFGRPERRIAVFSDSEAVYNAVVGDVIKEKYVLVTIGYESADLGFVGFPDATPRRLAVGRLR